MIQWRIIYKDGPFFFVSCPACGKEMVKDRYQIKRDGCCNRNCPNNRYFQKYGESKKPVKERKPFVHHSRTKKEIRWQPMPSRFDMNACLNLIQTLFRYRDWETETFEDLATLSGLDLDALKGEREWLLR